MVEAVPTASDAHRVSKHLFQRNLNFPTFSRVRFRKMIFRFLCLLFLIASGQALITFADLCFHSRQDYLLCQKNLASLYPAKPKAASDFFAGVDQATATKLTNGPEAVQVPGTVYCILPVYIIFGYLKIYYQFYSIPTMIS